MVESLKIYMPSYYLENVEMNKLLESEDGLFSTLESNVDRTFKNGFVLQMDSDAIAAMENMLEIKANSGESLNFRRERVINRLNNKPPFNLAFLKNKLNSIYGKDKYTLVIDYQNQVITLESSTENAQWFKEGHITILSIKPASLQYIHIPLYRSSITVTESATIAQMVYARAGSMRVGLTPFAQRTAERAVELL
ncbi:putative phage tail protein [Bavariicoccus seileri]|uniref:putative phage tail protein n=1 Tax=Bavariicoccus seileri TaxID=549685 RepID=UPI0003B37D73|nr:putative phage tail protein [Bavariicoccus seileri]